MWQGRLRLALIAIADHMERLRAQALHMAPMNERIFCAMGNPDFTSTCFADRAAKIVPIGVI